MPEETDKPAPKRARERKRRNYVAELADLQSRVDMAVRLLKRRNANGNTMPELVDVAIETLEGGA